MAVGRPDEKRPKPLWLRALSSGAGGARTPDLLHAIQVLLETDERVPNMGDAAEY